MLLQVRVRSFRHASEPLRVSQLGIQSLKGASELGNSEVLFFYSYSLSALCIFSPYPDSYWDCLGAGRKERIKSLDTVAAPCCFRPPPVCGWSSLSVFSHQHLVLNAISRAVCPLPAIIFYISVTSLSVCQLDCLLNEPYLLIKF